MEIKLGEHSRRPPSCCLIRLMGLQKYIFCKKKGVVMPPCDQTNAHCCSERITLSLFVFQNRVCHSVLLSVFRMSSKPKKRLRLSEKKGVLLPFLKLSGPSQLLSFNNSTFLVLLLFVVLVLVLNSYHSGRCSGPVMSECVSVFTILFWYLLSFHFAGFDSATSRAVGEWAPASVSCRLSCPFGKTKLQRKISERPFVRVCIVWM